MNLDKELVLKHLLNQGITHLYHANSADTSVSFIKKGGLLSRGAVENYNLYQTTQKSDAADKQFGVWNDIFLDNADLHSKFSNQNYYGPILFKFNLNILRYEYLPKIYVTKDNPMYWKYGISSEQMYFQTFEEFSNIYTNNSYREMLTLKNTFSPLPFLNYLTEIIIDVPPQPYKEIYLFDQAATKIRNAIQKYQPSLSHIPITPRDCSYTNCKCTTSYYSPTHTYILDKMF